MGTPRTEVTVACETGCALGEGPTWDAAQGLARWVDIDTGQLWEATVEVTGVGPARLALDLGPTLGAAVHASDGGLLLARARHLEHRAAGGAVTGVLELVPEGVASRLNDGACDPAGRYLVGSMSQDGRTGEERLWQVGHDGAVVVLADDLTLSNGLGWSPDGSRLYHVDTIPGTIWVRDYDPDTGRAGRRHVVTEVLDASPDGLAVDTEGNIWVALWGAAQVRCISPQGRVLEVVPTGAPLTTSCGFAGPELDRLLVTTAGRAQDGIRQTARGGSLLVCRPGVRGRPTTPWRPAPLGA